MGAEEEHPAEEYSAAGKDRREIMPAVPRSKGPGTCLREVDLSWRGRSPDWLHLQSDLFWQTMQIVFELAFGLRR